MIPQSEAEARQAIEISESGPDIWELRTPDGWCWEGDRHTNICFSDEQSQLERDTVPIFRCEATCFVCEDA